MGRAVRRTGRDGWAHGAVAAGRTRKDPRRSTGVMQADGWIGSAVGRSSRRRDVGQARRRNPSSAAPGRRMRAPGTARALPERADSAAPTTVINCGWRIAAKWPIADHQFISTDPPVTLAAHGDPGMPSAPRPFPHQPPAATAIGDRSAAATVGHRDRATPDAPSERDPPSAANGRTIPGARLTRRRRAPRRSWCWRAMRSLWRGRAARRRSSDPPTRGWATLALVTASGQPATHGRGSAHPRYRSILPGGPHRHLTGSLLPARRG